MLLSIWEVLVFNIFGARGRNVVKIVWEVKMFTRYEYSFVTVHAFIDWERFSFIFHEAGATLFSKSYDRRADLLTAYAEMIILQWNGLSKSIYKQVIHYFIMFI